MCLTFYICSNLSFFFFFHIRHSYYRISSCAPFLAFISYFPICPFPRILHKPAAGKKRDESTTSFDRRSIVRQNLNNIISSFLPVINKHVCRYTYIPYWENRGRKESQPGPFCSTLATFRQRTPSSAACLHGQGRKRSGNTDQEREKKVWWHFYTAVNPPDRHYNRCGWPKQTAKHVILICRLKKSRIQAVQFPRFALQRSIFDWCARKR